MKRVPVHSAHALMASTTPSLPLLSSFLSPAPPPTPLLLLLLLVLAPFPCLISVSMCVCVCVCVYACVRACVSLFLSSQLTKLHDSGLSMLKSTVSNSTLSLSAYLQTSRAISTSTTPLLLGFPWIRQKGQSWGRVHISRLCTFCFRNKTHHKTRNNDPRIAHLHCSWSFQESSKISSFSLSLSCSRFVSVSLFRSPSCPDVVAATQSEREEARARQTKQAIKQTRKKEEATKP